MMYRIKHILICAVMLSLLAATLFAADDASSYLILSDISPYKRLTQTFDAYSHKPKIIPGYTVYPGSGVLAGADHFIVDHSDVTYEADYQSDELGIGADVQVTKHYGSDSDKWLLHEVEKGFQKSGQVGSTYVSSNPLRDINGKKIYYTWGYYRWISNYVVVSIQFTDMTGTKPEPLEVVQAYLQKFPSTIPTTMVLNNDHKIQWIKDEMDRRLWLCDKWNNQIQVWVNRGNFTKAEESQICQEIVKSMNVFLDYREKYYGITAANEKNIIAGYVYHNLNDLTRIWSKLTEYKNWWTVHKNDAISI